MTISDKNMKMTIRKQSMLQIINKGEENWYHNLDGVYSNRYIDNFDHHKWGYISSEPEVYPFETQHSKTFVTPKPEIYRSNTCKFQSRTAFAVSRSVTYYAKGIKEKKLFNSISDSQTLSDELAVIIRYHGLLYMDIFRHVIYKKKPAHLGLQRWYLTSDIIYGWYGASKRKCITSEGLE